MQTRKILTPTDFSVNSDAALDYAAALARQSDATLLIVHVEEPMPAYMGEGYYGPPNPPNPEVRRMLEAIRPSDSPKSDKTVRYEHRLLAGDPAEQIVRLADEEKVDLIVMGTHGRTGLARLVMGSIAELVVRKAPCPVLTLKQPRKDSAAESQ